MQRARKFLSVAAAIVLVSASLNAHANTVTIDFEGQPSYSQVGDTYLSQGVSFGAGVIFANVCDYSLPSCYYNSAAFPPHSGTGVAGTTGSNPEPIAITFTSLVSDVSLWYTSAGDFTLDAYDSNGNAIGSTTGGSNYGSTSQVSLNLSGISYVTFSNTDGAGFDTIDDLSFDTLAATPEPSSLALLGTGIFGIVGTLRRRAIRA